MRILAVDPGTQFLGYALVETHARGKLMPKQILGAGWIEGDGEEYIERTADIIAKLYGVTGAYAQIRQAILEVPEARHDPTGIRSSESGSLAKLAFTAGAVCGVLLSRGIQVFTTVPSRWKGQLPKHLMLKRLQSRGLCLGWAGDKAMNGSDAVGLADWYAANHF